MRARKAVGVHVIRVCGLVAVIVLQGCAGPRVDLIGCPTGTVTATEGTYPEFSVTDAQLEAIRQPVIENPPPLLSVWDAQVEGGVSLFGQILVDLVLPLLFD